MYEDKKIGIISLFNIDNVNFGNRLQAYALNRYLSKIQNEYKVDSLYFKNLDENVEITEQIDIFKMIKSKSILLYEKIFKNKRYISVENRLQNFNHFCEKNISMCSQAMTWNDLIHSNYDVFIVGSDIIWGQNYRKISKIRFLDFNSQKKFKRIAYAASFGQDWIPEQNVDKICEYLGNFDAISVRENSSVQMLNDIGIKNVIHAIDPTLLISMEEWCQVEKKPKFTVEKYIFVYLLGDGKKLRSQIINFANKEHLKIVTVPYANGQSNFVDKNFGDIQVMDCAIEEWLWLIHHAEYIITDSFHGIVFSTIFQKKFLALKREFVEDINNRITDYLNTIDQKNKFVDLETLDIDSLEWDYKAINGLLEEKKKVSKEFLNQSLGLGGYH